MNKNLFEVGEVVVLQSSFSPDMNGDCKVTSFEFVSNRKVLGLSNLYSGFVYSVDIIGLNGIDSWIESALRKKHNPSEFRYNELIKNLNTKIQERV